MKQFDWLPRFLTCLQDAKVDAKVEENSSPTPTHSLILNNWDWEKAARVASDFGCRWAGVWGDQKDKFLSIYACLVYQGDYLLLTTELDLIKSELLSHTPCFPGADRLERHLQDMFGITFKNHPNGHRWTRHQAWPKDSFPLLNDFPQEGPSESRSPADIDYPFNCIQGNGVYEIPVGPVHAGIIEPGHFRFQAVGEDILRLEARLGYTHKGIEKIAVGRHPSALAQLAGRVSGDSTVAHTWAACMAMENATDSRLPERALFLRAILAERERVANHLGDIGAICNDVGFSFMHIQCARLRELWQRRNHELFSHRLLMDTIVPGGIACDLDEKEIEQLITDHKNLLRATKPLLDIINDQPSLEDRLVGTGHLSSEDARKIGCTGYVGKASSQDFDVRRDHAYSPYDRFVPLIPVDTEGDVAARVRIRMAEVRESLKLMDAFLKALPAGPVKVELTPVENEVNGLGIVEGWRGEIITYVRLDNEGRIARFFPRDPSWFTWPALERLIHGNIVPDFPVCNKSINGSYSGQDL